MQPAVAGCISEGGVIIGREELPGDRMYDYSMIGKTEPVLRVARLLELTGTAINDSPDWTINEVKNIREMQWLCWYVGSCTDWAGHVSKFREIHEKTGLRYRDIALKSIELLCILGDMPETVAEGIRWLHDNYGVYPGHRFRL